MLVGEGRTLAWWCSWGGLQVTLAFAWMKGSPRGASGKVH